MRSRAWMVCLAAAAAVGGCGGDATDKPAAANSGPAPVQTQPASDLAAFTVKDELKGFEPMGAGGGATDPAEWLNIAQETTLTTKELAGLGFVAGFRRNLREKGSSTTFGLSQVEEFKTPEQARAEIKRFLKPTPGIKVAPFRVRGLAGAQGATARGSTVGDSVMFTQGKDFLIIS